MTTEIALPGGKRTPTKHAYDHSAVLVTAGLKDRAHFLRSNGRSITQIAAALGRSSSTVGAWLKGVGETQHFTVCAWPPCSETFITNRSHARFCCNQHRYWHRDQPLITPNPQLGAMTP